MNLTNRLIIFLNIYLAIISIVVTALIVAKFCNNHPQPKQQPRTYSLSITVGQYDDAGSDGVVHEKKERLSYALSSLVITAISFLWLILYKTKLADFWRKKSQKRVAVFVDSLCYFSLLILLILIPYFSYQVILFPNDISGFSLVVLLIFFTAIVLTAVIFGGSLWKKRISKEIVKKSYIFCALIFSALAASYLVFDENYQLMNGYSVNFNPISYPTIQQFFGNNLLIDFRSLYGLFPYFLQIVLVIFPPKILTITLALAALLMLSLLLLALVIFVAIENKLLAIIGFFALLFWEFFAISFRFFERYLSFQYEPIRLIFPALLLGFIYLFYKRPTAIKYYASLTLFSVGTMWNIDSGLPTFLTLVVMIGYEKFKNNFDVKALAIHLMKSFSIFIASWLTLIITLKIKSGIWPNLGWAFYGQKAVIDFAYAALPILNSGLWSIIVLTYIIGLSLSIQNYLNKNHSLQNSMMLALTLLGIGLFSYFVGRSHVSNAAHCGYPALILWIIFADKFCTNYAKGNWREMLKSEIVLYSLPLVVICYFAVVFVGEIFSSTMLRDKFITHKFQRQITQPYWVSQSDFIKKNISKTDISNQDILLIDLDDNDYYFDLEFGIKSPFSFVNPHHMFYQYEFADFIELVGSGTKKWAVLIEPHDKEITPLFSENEMAQIKNSLAKNYQLQNAMKIEAVGDLTIFQLKDATK